MQRPLAHLILTAMLAVAAPLALFAADDTKTYTTQEEAPASYKLQGEYVGKVETDGAEVKYGVQVIALGNDKFQAVTYPGGLPGEGYSGGNYDELLKVEGTASGNKVEFKGDNFVATLHDGKIEVIGEGGAEIGTLEKVVRKSPTLGAKAPEGALVLFDGTSADAWNNGKIVQEDLLLADCESKEKFGDHTLHLEFRTPFKPDARGQARGNSGLYIQSRYECQVLDSFGLTGADNECGGIYKVSKPKVNMCFPPLTWQTYDVDFTAAKYDADGKKTENARVTIKHNGVVIHDDLELPSNTPGRHQEGPGPDAIYLQGHGNPVVYRNIWVVKK
ncbi:hypothetical protein Pan97_05030 [Bremerella volcania]|uniref:3-keto-alpha-glucoside-1,2-lyase/3-keto-2-hydroxy-glucal hydratase domain-containing protein n=1 Tax=Bremerella volcania TaxID=2527984 RepID=A0A518C2T1_9BACT|nr:DUF1080 domain-containing protein [Bremerella volcania]QDU73530.1 hypothetical protein Pan97_05030 [Bremerella volcania]